MHAACRLSQGPGWRAGDCFLPPGCGTVRGGRIGRHAVRPPAATRCQDRQASPDHGRRPAAGRVAGRAAGGNQAAACPGMWSGSSATTAVEVVGIVANRGAPGKTELDAVLVTPVRPTGRCSPTHGCCSPPTGCLTRWPSCWSGCTCRGSSGGTARCPTRCPGTTRARGGLPGRRRDQQQRPELTGRQRDATSSWRSSTSRGNFLIYKPEACFQLTRIRWRSLKGSGGGMSRYGPS
jgi:hypothetical protein